MFRTRQYNLTKIIKKCIGNALGLALFAITQNQSPNSTEHVTQFFDIINILLTKEPSTKILKKIVSMLEYLPNVI